MTAGRTVNAANHHWGTPRVYVQAVKDVLGEIALDPCSNEFSIVGALNEYRLPDIDGLSASWDFPTIYVNPPYGADRERGTRISDWLQRCVESHRVHRSEVIALVPVATNTSHWKRHIWTGSNAIAFLYDTRLKFLEAGREGGKGAPMSCAMVYWGTDIKRFMAVFSRFGAAVDLHACQIGSPTAFKSQVQMELPKFNAEPAPYRTYGVRSVAIK